MGSDLFLACLDCELGSVSSEFLGSTTALSLSALWSGHGTLNVLHGAWEVDRPGGGESGLALVVRLDLGGRVSVECLLSKVGSEGLLGAVITVTLADRDGHSEGSLGGDDVSLSGSDGLGVSHDIGFGVGLSIGEWGEFGLELSKSGVSGCESSGGGLLKGTPVALFPGGVDGLGGPGS